MLVITRKKDQSILLGDEIKIKILEINDDAIKIGIQAPKQISILREEIYTAIKEENKTVVSSDSRVLEIIKGIFS